MDSSARDSRVNPIGYVEAEKEQLRMENVGRGGNEEETLLMPKDGDQMEEEVKPKIKRKVQWNDTNGNKLAEILEFFPSDVSDSDDEESDSCFCIIM